MEEDIKPLNTPKYHAKTNDIRRMILNHAQGNDGAGIDNADTERRPEISERCPKADTPKAPTRPPTSATIAKAELSVYKPTKIAKSC